MKTPFLKTMLIFSIMIMVLLVPTCKKSEIDMTKPIKIGFIGPLTGNAANYGKLMTHAIWIAVDEINAEGGIAGQPVEFIPEDSEGKPDKATAAAEKLISIEKVAGIIGAVFSSSSLAIAPRCEAARTILMSPSSTHADLTGKGNYIFRTIFSDSLQASVFAKYVKNEMHIDRVAILHLKNDYSQGIAEAFQKQFEADGGVITMVESALQDDKDFKTQLTTIKDTDSQALYMPGYVAECAQILKQASQLGLNMTMLSADGYSNYDIFDLAGKFVEGVTFTKPAESGSQDFVTKYEDRWGEKPDSFSHNSYDGAMIILNAIKQAAAESAAAGETIISKSRIQEIIAATNGYMGVSGEITFLPNGDPIKNIGISVSGPDEFSQIGVFKIEDDQLIQVQ